MKPEKWCIASKPNLCGYINETTNKFVGSMIAPSSTIAPSKIPQTHFDLKNVLSFSINKN